MDGLIAYVLSKKYADAVGEKVAREGFKVEVEDDRSILETTGQEKIFYFLPKEESKPEDGYDEFIWTDSQGWEQVGVTDIDLSAYALKATTLAGYGITDGQTTIDSSHKLSSDLVDDTNNTNKFVTTADKSVWNAKYDKPSTGIPKTDLTSDVQTSLDKADTALQYETYTGTITGITMNGESKGTSGTVDLGTVVTSCDGSVTGDSVTFVKSVSISGHTLTGTTQAADVTITSNSSSIPTSRAVKNYADTTLGYTITTRLTNTTSGGLTQNIEFIPSQAFNLTSTWNSLWNVDHTQTGTGTIIWTLNGTEISRQTNVAQGALSFNIMPYLAPSATHTAVQKIIDAEQNERTLTYTITTTAEIPVWTVNFYKDSTIVQTSYVENGQDVKWLNLVSMLKDGYYWEGWDTSLKNITHDTDIHGVYSQYSLPASPADVSQFDYIYTNDPSYTSAYTFGEFLAVNLSDDFEDYVTIGNKMRLLLPDNNLHTHAMEFIAADFKHFKVAGSDPAVYANVVWDYHNAFTSPDGYQMNTTGTNAGGFKESKMFKQNLDAILALLPEFISNNIGPLEYKCFNYLDDDYQAQGDTVSHKLYVASGIEMGVIGASTFPYTFEIDSGSRNAAFPYYTTNALRQKKQYVGQGSARDYWLRTAVSQSSTHFWLVTTSGAGYYSNANFSCSVGFGFCFSRV